MQLRVLGCSGSMAAHCHTTAFLLDDDVLLDAGSGVGNLTLPELAAIDDILLSHAHLDHVLGIALLADSVQSRRAGRPPIRVHGLAATLQALRDHIFNGVIWPDFTRLPRPQAPLLTLHPFEVGDVLALGPRRIEVLPAEHTVPACGFALLDEEGCLAYSGDTAPHPALWQRLSRLPLSGLIVETAFAEHDSALARLSKHLHPSALVAQLQALAPQVPVYITHAKPGERELLMRDILARAPRQPVQALEVGMRLHSGALNPQNAQA